MKLPDSLTLWLFKNTFDVHFYYLFFKTDSFCRTHENEHLTLTNCILIFINLFCFSILMKKYFSS
jgi:hypothetical protein